MLTYSKIKQLCKSNGITVTGLEKELGFARGSLCKVDTNKPSMEKVQKLADYFKMSVDSLMGDTLAEAPERLFTKREIVNLFAGTDSAIKEFFEDVLEENKTKEITHKVRKLLPEDFGTPTEPITLAAHFEGKEFTEEELEEIKNFAEYVKNRKK